MSENKFCTFNHLTQDSKNPIPICVDTCKFIQLSRQLNQGSEMIGEPCRTVFEEDLPGILGLLEISRQQLGEDLSDPTRRPNICNSLEAAFNYINFDEYPLNSEE